MADFPGTYAIIDPPELRLRRSGLLLDAVDPLRGPDDMTPGDPDVASAANVRWMGGVTFSPLGCQTLRTQDSLYCADDTISAADDDDPLEGHQEEVEQGDAWPEFTSFAVLADEHCSALSIDQAWLRNRLDERFRIGISKAVAYELIVGNLASRSLGGDAIDSGSGAVSPSLAVGLIEQGLAGVLNGAEGLIHMSPQAFSDAGSNGMFVADGDQWRTRTGHRVVSDAGYSDPATVYGSGPVMVALSPPRRLGAEGYGAWNTRNVLQVTSMAQAIFAYDPCSVVSTSVTYA